MTESLTYIDLDDLGLDPENPRLPTTIKRDTQSILEYIAKTSSITELMTAIGQHNYFPGEPLIVVPNPKRKSGYIVVEGNRRLTALKLLNDPTLVARSNIIKQAAEEATFKPQKIPCLVFDKRSDVINYLGYRHITGIKQWEPLAKARYIEQYFASQTSTKANPEVRYKEVARSIGSRPTYIKRQLDGMAVYNYIESKGFFEIDGLDEENIPFSILTTAIGYEAILDFISKSEHPYIFPNKFNREQVEELTHWLFEKDESGETKLGDSRNIKKLALIVESDEALEELRSGSTVDRAYNKTRGINDEFAEAITAVESNLGKALAIAALITSDDISRRKVRNIAKNSAALAKLVE